MTERTVYPWTAAAWRHFEEQNAADRLPHAMMLRGAQGLGKQSLALAMAQFLQCTAQNSRPCGECQGCRLTASESHPDIRYLRRELAPSGKEKQEIGVAQVRALKEFMGLTHAGRGRKVVIIEPADALNRSASNSLLKLLEEPPGHALFILICHRPEALVATIRSRCQSLTIPTPSQADAVTWLTAQGVENPARWLALASGAPVMARKLFTEEPEQLSRYDEVLSDCLNLMFNRRPGVVETARRWQSIELSFLLEWQLSLARDLVRLMHGVKDAHFENHDRLEALRRVRDRIHLRKVIVLYDKLVSQKAALGAPLRVETARETLALDWKNSLAG